MSPVVRGAAGRLTSDMRLVSRNPSHFRSGHWLLAAEGGVLVVLGGAGFASNVWHGGVAPVLVLALTPWHSAILLSFGLLAMIGSMNRRAAITVTAVGTVAFLALVVVGAVSAISHTAGPLGLEPRDIVLHAMVSAANFAILYWLIPDVLEGPDWVRLPSPRESSPSPTSPVATTEPVATAIPAQPPLADDSSARAAPSEARSAHPTRKECEMNTPQNIVITGASAGVGRAVVRAFGERGANITLLARGQSGLDGAVKDVESAGGQALAIPTDVADYEQVASAAERAEEKFGPIDVWVNVAFTSVFAPFHDIKADEYRRVTEVSYLGYVHGTMVALEHMRPRNRGTIVQVGSALGSRGIPLQSAYCGAKHAINGFTESVRTELLHDHSDVHITVAQMPALNTPQFSWVLSRLPKQPQPVPPIYQPEIAARAVLFAADHPNRKQYWVGASTAATTIGQRIAPALLDRYLAKSGYASQQTKDTASPDRPSNLWEPVDGEAGSDHGAHGTFDRRSLGVSPQMWTSQHPRATSVAAAGAAAGAAITLARLRRG
ncbi:hypothetical protein BH09ACT8_BH09ACT8_15040 [soil metagenome]